MSTDLDLRPKYERPIWWPTGSAYIGSDGEPQDYDYVEYVSESASSSREAELLAAGWEVCGTGYTRQDDDKWCAYRHGNCNLILCWCPLVFLRWAAFSELARRCHFTSKMERIELNAAVLEGNVTAAMNIVRLPNFTTAAADVMQEFVNE